MKIISNNVHNDILDYISILHSSILIYISIIISIGSIRSHRPHIN